VRSFFEHKRNSLTPAKIVMIILRFIFQLVGHPEVISSCSRGT
jgi:hypothetical protein